MLKKTLAIILTILTLLVLSACGLFPTVQTEEVMTFDVSEFTETENEVDTTVDTTEITPEVESSSEEEDDQNDDFFGTYICNYSSVKAAQKDENTETIQRITFFEDGTCVMLFRLKEGACQFDGEYNHIDSSSGLKVTLDLSGSEFDGFVPSEFVFSVKSDRIRLESKGFSTVRQYDSFYHMSDEDLAKLNITLKDSEEVNEGVSPFLDGVEPLPIERALYKVVPDFLDEEQQMLYRKAYSLLYLKRVQPSLSMEFSKSLNYYIEEKYQTIMLPYGETEMSFEISQGRYQNWDDLLDLWHSVFTEEYTADLLGLNDNFSAFYNYNGKLATIYDVSGISMDSSYNLNFEDKFELISQNDSEIVFKLIAHFSSFYPKNGETYEERDARLESGWEWTEEFAIRMEMTESGWRFSEFHVPAYGG